MNLFEKIFNFQMTSRLDEAGAMAVTSHERDWLRTMLAHPEAPAAFETSTLLKLQQLLDADFREPAAPLQDLPIIEKAQSAVVHIYHPMLRTLRRLIMRKAGIQLAYSIKDGSLRGKQLGFPYKLEYSMVKKEWYLLWYNVNKRCIMLTKLRSILHIEEASLSEKTIVSASAAINRYLTARRQYATIEVISDYNKELSRILYAFSCFEKQVDYKEEAGTYYIKLAFSGDEAEFVLSKIRFLGKRVKVIEGEYLRRRLLEAAQKSLARYEQPNS